jgi:hypothetical protein
VKLNSLSGLACAGWLAQEGVKRGSLRAKQDEAR